MVIRNDVSADLRFGIGGFPEYKERGDITAVSFIPKVEKMINTFYSASGVWRGSGYVFNVEEQRVKAIAWQI